MTYDWQLIDTSPNGRNLYWDKESHFHCITEPWETPQDASAFLFGVTPETREWFDRRWEFLANEE